jgi:MYXO-CTERM domain-containing protein
MYSVNEEALPVGEFGFLNTMKNTHYLPNEGPPYLNVVMPINCSLPRADASDACVLDKPDYERILVHAEGDRLGLKLHIDEVNDNGNITVSLLSQSDGETTGGGAAAPPPASGDDGGCAVSNADDERWSAGAALLMALLFGGWLRRRRTQ